MTEKENREIVEVNKIKNNAVATMNNQLIQARYSLTIEEQRIFLALISLISPDDEDFKNYKIPVSTITELTRTKHKNMYRVLNEATDRLMQRILKIEVIDENNKRVFKKFSFISYAEYKEGEGYLIVGIDERLKPFLLKLKEKYTNIPLEYIFPLRSIYAIRLYELLKQYENTGFRVDYLPDLREMLGVEPEEYPRFDNFERRVIKQAIKEINEKTDIEVSYKKKRTGRKITHIEFKIKPKNAKIGDTTETKKPPSQSVDTQGQKKAKKFNSEDLWKGVLKILEYNYNVHPADIDFIRYNTRVEYNAKADPKEMIVYPEGNKNITKAFLKEYESKIDEIVEKDTNGTYVFKIGD